MQTKPEDGVMMESSRCKSIWFVHLAATQLFGLLLIVGACLKAISLVMGKVTILDIDFGAAGVLFVIFVEICVGVCLVFRPSTRISRAVALIVSCAFAVIHLLNLFVGQEMCSCFGQYSISEPIILGLLTIFFGVSLGGNLITSRDSYGFCTAGVRSLRGVCIVLISMTCMQLLTNVDILRLTFPGLVNYSPTYSVAQSARTVVAQVPVARNSIFSRAYIGSKTSCSARIVPEELRLTRMNNAYFFQAYVGASGPRRKHFQFQTYFSDGTMAGEEVLVVRN
jgi:hypothetical protein